MLFKPNFVFIRAVQVTTIFTAMLISTTVKSQINDVEGVWNGAISCGVLQIASTRSTKGFISPIEIIVALGSLTGKRENQEIFESFSGSIERTGRVNLEGRGRFKDDSTRVWTYRLNGMLTGSTIKLDGLMESGDRKVRLRTCQLELSNSDMKRKKMADSVNQENAKAAAEKATSEGVTAKKIPSEKAASAKASGDQAAADKASAEKAAVAKAAAEKAYAEKAASDKAAGDKAAEQKAATESKKAPIKVRSTMDL